MKEEIIFKIASAESEILTTQKIRKEIFVKEQGIPEELEIDGDDASCIHLLALTSNQQIIGTGRLAIHADTGVLSRISVIEAYRNKGIGKHILIELEKIARQKNCNDSLCHLIPTSKSFIKVWDIKKIVEAKWQVNTFYCQ